MINNTTQIVVFDRQIDKLLADGRIVPSNELRPGERCLGDHVPSPPITPRPDRKPSQHGARWNEDNGGTIPCPICQKTYRNAAGLSGHTLHQHPEFHHGSAATSSLTLRLSDDFGVSDESHRDESVTDVEHDEA